MHLVFFIVFFFFKQKTAYEMRISDWSSDVCSSDLSAHYGFGDRLVGRGIRLADLRPAQDGPDARDQQPLGKGLADIIVRPHGQAQRLVQLIGLGRQEDDRHMALFRSEEHTSELQSLMRISYDVFCLKKKKTINKDKN